MGELLDDFDLARKMACGGARRGLRDQDLLDLHEDILEQSEDGVRELIQEFHDDPDSLKRLLMTEVELEPAEEDHELNRLPLTSIHRAALLETEVILSVLVHAHPEVGVDAQLKRNGYTPLHVATVGNVMPTLNYLTTNGACVNAKGHKGSTPMHMAASQGFADIARLLVVRGANIDETDQLGRMPLHLAAEKGHSTVVGFFLKREADVEVSDDKGRTPLHAAQIRANADISTVLINKGADVNARDRNGDSPLLVLLRHWNSGESTSVLQHAPLCNILTLTASLLHQCIQY